MLSCSCSKEMVRKSGAVEELVLSQVFAFAAVVMCYVVLYLCVKIG